MGRRLTVIRAQFARVQPRPLLVVLAAVFAGLSVVLVVAAAATTTPLVLLAAVPLAMTALLMWYQGTGRLTPGAFGRRSRRRGRRGRRRVTRSTAGGTSRSGHREEWEGGGERRRTTFREEAAREARYRARRQARRHARHEADGGEGSGAASTWTSHRERADRVDELTRAEAYDVLGLDPTATDAAVRDAYREKAKRAHPDTEGGSAESFQQLNDAYERLLED